MLQFLKSMSRHTFDIDELFQVRKGIVVSMVTTQYMWQYDLLYEIPNILWLNGAYRKMDLVMLFIQLFGFVV